MLEKRLRISAPHKSENWPSAQDFLMIMENTAFQRAQEDYLPWDLLRLKDWAGESNAKLWWALKMSRRNRRTLTPVKDVSGTFYSADLGRHLEFLHEIDMELGGYLLGMSDFSEGDKRQIIRRNLIEESIASSKLEGANTSRETARKMLAEGRRPKDKSEWMIANNHAAMNWIEETGKNQHLSFELITELHRKVTSGTLKNTNFEGKLRETLDDRGKKLVIKPWDETTIVYETPDKEFVQQELPRLIAFANDDDNSPFIHPLIKAIILHFWIGLLHPFEDGNGRLARIIFYWYMLRKGYWALSYLSLSERILKSPKQYAMAFVYAEQDDFDMNYFIQYNVEKLKLAREHLRAYLKGKISDNKERIKIAQLGLGLNERQTRLLQYMFQGELSHTSVTEHHHTYPEMGYVTAVSDLKSLVEKDYLRKQKNGRNVIYLPTDKVQPLFR